MPGSTRTMALCTLVALVAVSGYTVALSSDGWLWFGWCLLGLLTAASALTGRRR